MNPDLDGALFQARRRRMKIQHWTIAIILFLLNLGIYGLFQLFRKHIWPHLKEAMFVESKAEGPSFEGAVIFLMIVIIIILLLIWEKKA